MSLTLRLTLLFTAVSTVVILTLGYLIGLAVEEHFVEQDIEILNGKLALTRNALEKVRTTDDLAQLPQVLDDALFGHAGLAIAVIAPDGQTLFATRDVDFPHALLAKPVSASGSSPTVWTSAQNKPFRGVAVHMPTGIDASPPAIVAVATDISHHEHFMASFRSTLWSFFALATLLTGLLGWWAVRRGLSPLQAMKRKVEGITAQRLDARLAVDAVPLELADLAQTLNTMLERLGDSFQRLSDFASDLAHEFRTPVSNLLMQSQVTLAQSRTDEEYREILASNIEEFERLSRMIADMLFIAKADQGQIVPTRELLDLGSLIGNLVEAHRPFAEDQGVTVTCTGDGQLHGDSLMIRRAVSNLLSNAIRHSPPGGQVAVTIRATDRGGACIEVANTGDTIPAEHLPRLFDRFYRADPSRTGDGAHTGLGLAIVKSIAEAHGGQVSVLSQDGVTCFSVTLANPPKLGRRVIPDD